MARAAGNCFDIHAFFSYDFLSFTTLKKYSLWNMRTRCLLHFAHAEMCATLKKFTLLIPSAACHDVCDA